MTKSHKDIDWEYIVEGIAQNRYSTKSNTLDYSDLKSIAEDEVNYYMDNEEDTLRAMRKRIYFRYKHKLTYIREYPNTIWENWRENENFITRYESDLNRGIRFNKLLKSLR